MARQIVAMTSNIATSANDIHTGDNTHHQDHEINPISFKVIKSPVKRVVSDGPTRLMIVVLFSMILLRSYFMSRLFQ